MEDFNAILTYERDLGYASKSPPHEPPHIGPLHARPPQNASNRAAQNRAHFLSGMLVRTEVYPNRTRIPIFLIFYQHHFTNIP